MADSFPLKGGHFKQLGGCLQKENSEIKQAFSAGLNFSYYTHKTQEQCSI
jgi:hypothetical protein